jgi:hypothetical protein
VIHPRVLHESHRVDDQSVTVPAADRVFEVGGGDVRRITAAVHAHRIGEIEDLEDE